MTIGDGEVALEHAQTLRDISTRLSVITATISDLKIKDSGLDTLIRDLHDRIIRMEAKDCEDKIASLDRAISELKREGDKREGALSLLKGIGPFLPWLVAVAGWFYVVYERVNKSLGSHSPS